MRERLLSDCVARSHPLDAVLDSTENAPLPPDRDPDDLLADWRDAFDSEEAFEERLGFSDRTTESAREQFADAAENSPDSLPPAFEVAEQAVDRAVEMDSRTTRSLVERHANSPFVHLLAPLVAAGSEGVELGDCFTPTAVESLEDWLFERLTEVFQHPLFILFKAHQRTEYPDTDFEDQTDSTAVYEEFVTRHREADYEQIFETYPVLLRLLGVLTDQWRESVWRLEERIADDRSALERAFNEGAELGHVADVEALSDDPHGEGEVVLGVHFAEDCSVVYKPRSVDGEAAFNNVLDWVNAHAEIPDLYAPTVLDRGAYGWMEFVGHSECDSTGGVERYYERMGGLTALAFVLGSTDLHQDNVVAMGECPVIVDQEMALSPQFDTTNAPSSPALSSLVEDSILSTVLIPFTSSLEEEDAEVITNSGLAELDDVEDGLESPTFLDPNTDAMELTFRGTYSPDGTNLPRLDGEIRNVSSHLDGLKRGFRGVTDAIRSNRETFLDSGGPLDAFEGCAIRYLLRPTGHYSSKLTESVYSSQLRSGLQQSLALESLYRIFVPTNDEGDLWQLVATEKETLRRFTVPRFTVEAGGHELKDGRGEPQGVFVDQSPLAHARERVADLDEHWTETQLRLLDLAFTDSKVPEPVSGRSNAPSASNTSSPAGESSSSSERTGTVSDADAPQAVVSNVVDRLETTTTEYPDGSYRWAEMARLSPNNAFLLQEPELHLYEGYAGVGLFLAAVAAVRDDDELAALTRRVLKPVELAFENDDASQLGIGGMTGRGSVAYALVTAGDLLDDPELVETAREVARKTTREEIDADEELDVIGGAAGELLAQLAVYDRTGDEAALDRARWCGDRLLDATTETESGYRVPIGGNDSEDDLRFAFAHGVGGIGHALVELSSVTGEAKYARVGRDALELEVELWRREHDEQVVGNPYDGTEKGAASHEGDATSSDGDTGQIWGWCNGAAGVGLSRVATAETTTSAETMAPAERAATAEGTAPAEKTARTETATDSSIADLATLREDLRTETSLEASLCCGSAGRALFMLDAGETFDDPELVARGEELFGSVLERAEREGRIPLGNHLPMLPRFGLFTGLTGVGYVALQIEARESEVDLPNVTRLE